MHRFGPFLLFLLATIASAQAIPGSYIVEFDSAPAAQIAISRRQPLTAVRADVATRRSAILQEHASAEVSVRALGGRVRRHYDTLLNGMAIDLPDAAVNNLRQIPGVRAVYPNTRHELYLDHAINVHRIADAWKTVTNGQAGAGAGIKIGIIDSGIDINHPGFKGFTTDIPAGFPIVSSDAEKANTNNKVIVSRDYSGAGGLDTFGHGTGVAMIVAGMPTQASINFRPLDFSVIQPVATGQISGLAPGAWLGNYRVTDNSGGSSLELFLQALQDAVNDGMNIVNYSSGGPMIDLSAETGPEARAIHNAVAAGVLVVTAAGNTGPEPGTIGQPAAAPDAIAVGANANERVYLQSVILPNVAPYVPEVPDADWTLTDPVTGPLTDVGTLGSDSLGCADFPAGSLTGQVALISRGTCNFDVKLANAQSAGAVGAVIYDNVPNELINMNLTATLPAVFITQADGADMKKQIAANPGVPATIDFSGTTALAYPSDYVWYYSSGGPTPNAGLKPDLLAVGEFMLTADTTQNNPFTPFIVEDGTSFSSPLVTGSLAVLMSARPGLAATDYRSLIMNSAPPLTFPDGSPMTPQIGGTGKLDLLGAMRNNLTSTPASINFQSAPGTVNTTQPVVFTNTGTSTDTFAVSVSKINASDLMPSVDLASFTLDPGKSQTVNVKLTGSGLATGEYHGFLTITGSTGATATRVPYWFGVPGTAVQFISILNQVDYTAAANGDSASIIMRCTDQIGLPIACGTPTVTATGARARISAVTAYPGIPGSYRIDVRAGRADANGYNVFTITAGGVSRDVTLVIQ